MAKTVPLSKLQEWKALDCISPIIHAMPSIFREIAKDDFGIDGEIEVLVPKEDGDGYETTGGIIKVQAKSGKSYVKRDCEASFATPVDRDDLELWHNATHPVVFIVYHPGDDKLYWKEVKKYIQNTPNVFQPPLRIVFNKTADEFSPACYDDLREIANVSPPRVSKQEREQMFSNLLLIRRLPRTIWSAPTDCKNYQQIKETLRERGEFVPPFSIIGNSIYTLSDLRNKSCSLRDFCDPTEISSQAADDWWEDKDLLRSYVSMLNRLLRVHAYTYGLRYNPNFRRYYFPRQNESDLEFKKAWYNVRTKRQEAERIVAKLYRYGKYEFWRHTAANLRFILIGNSWFLRIIPEYLFTIDGEEPVAPSIAGPYTTKLKSRERNLHVLNHILFWSDILSHGESEIRIELDFEPVILIEKMPLLGVAEFAIPYDPAIYDEPPAVEQLDFADQFDASDEDSYEEY